MEGTARVQGLRIVGSQPDDSALFVNLDPAEHQQSKLWCSFPVTAPGRDTNRPYNALAADDEPSLIIERQI